MQVSDVAFGVLLIILLSWTMIIALNQNNIAIAVSSLDIKQQTLISPEENCPALSGFSLVPEEAIGANEYTVIPKHSETKQLVLCVYEKKNTD